MTDEARGDRRLLLHAALDGELDAAGELRLERLLAEDAELAAEHARLKALRGALRTHLRREPAPAALRAKILAAAEDAAAPVPIVARRRAAPPSWRAFGGAIAASVMLSFGAGRYLAVQDASDAPMQAILAAHMRGQISGRPIDVASSDRHTVKPWLAAKLPVAAAVADLSGDGFALLGGRLDMVAGTAVPTLVYQRREHLISVTEMAGASGFPSSPQRRMQAGYPLFVWSDGQRGYAAVSDLAPEELAGFVAAFRRVVAKEQGGEVR